MCILSIMAHYFNLFQALLEANRYLIKHLDVCGLNPPKKSSDIPELQ